MSGQRHLLVDISAHGLGHLAQTAPVIASLRRACPPFRLSIRSGLDFDRLRRRIEPPFEHINVASDFGFVMHNAVDINYVATAARYRYFHADWDARVAAEATALADLGVTAVLANAAYLPLAGAAAAGIPALGLCSLNWADLFHHCFATAAWAPPVHRQILAAYNAAPLFLRVTPGLPMADFAHCQAIGPIAARGTSKPLARAATGAALGLPLTARWVLVAMGGMEFRLPMQHWPQLDGVVWLCPADGAHLAVGRDDVVAFDAPGVTVPFTDILTAADAVLTKPGYGTFAEATCNATPLLYLPRDDWPEEAYLVAWMQQHGRIGAVSRADLMAGKLADALVALWQQSPPAPPVPTGADEAASLARQLFGWQ